MPFAGGAHIALLEAVKKATTSRQNVGWRIHAGVWHVCDSPMFVRTL